MNEEKTAPEFTVENATEISATELRTHTRSILERAKFQGERFVVYTHGQAMAVVVGVGEFGRLKELPRPGYSQADVQLATTGVATQNGQYRLEPK